MIDWKHEIRQRLAHLNLEPAREAAVTEEISQHLEDCCAELLARGAAPQLAYRQILAQLESDLLARELRALAPQAPKDPFPSTTHPRTNMIPSLCQDPQSVARMLPKN